MKMPFADDPFKGLIVFLAISLFFQLIGIGIMIGQYFGK